MLAETKAEFDCRERFTQANSVMQMSTLAKSDVLADLLPEIRRNPQTEKHQ